ncbi:MAG: CoA transferase [Thermaerobacter sp.]|nr:CoA transferase [Thermaerobacter sp.]
MRVLDLSTMLVGPYTTQILADLGADVIKVESAAGDPMRHVGPMRNPGMGGIFLTANRGKRSLVLDLKAKGAAAVILRMSEQCDVFVHNMRSRAAKRLGIEYERVRQVNPRIIYCGITGYGEGGPYAGRPAYDDTIQAAAGMAYLESFVAGEPRYSPSDIADKVSGLYAAIGILAALTERERSGQGHKVSTPMFESMAAFVLMEHLYAAAFQPPLSPPYYERTVSKERRPYPTKDGFISVAIYTDRHWSRFFEVVGRRDLAVDPRFCDLSARSKHYDELYALITGYFASKTTREWLDIFADEDVPAMPVNSTEDLLRDPHLQAVRFFESIDHPTEGAVLRVGNPIHIDPYDGGSSELADGLGASGEEVLAELGWSAESIAELLSSGVVKLPRHSAQER